MLANLNIDYLYPEVVTDTESVTDYVRVLSLNDAVASTNFSINGLNYSREYFASFEDGVLVIRISADKKRSVSFKLGSSRPVRATLTVHDDILYLEGQLNDGYDGD